LHCAVSSSIGLASTFRYLAPPSLQIRTTTYGGNCGAPAGNATRDVALICNGRQNCSYLVDVERLSDPAPRCAKNVVVEYSCAPNVTVLRQELPAEAGFKSVLQLACSGR
jgi:hypothetical protein